MGKTMKRYFPVFVLPTLLAFAVAFMVPFIMGIYLSFCDFTTVTNAKFVGISNYVKAFTNPDFLKALWFTVKFAVSHTSYSYLSTNLSIDNSPLFV